MKYEKAAGARGGGVGWSALGSVSPFLIEWAPAPAYNSQCHTMVTGSDAVVTGI